MNSQFNLLTKDEPSIDHELRHFLPQAYNLKTVADYETGPGSIVPRERVEAAIATAARFVNCVAALIPSNGPSVS